MRSKISAASATPATRRIRLRLRRGSRASGTTLSSDPSARVRNDPVRSATMALAFVRPARPDDAAEIARLQLTTWRYAYRRILPRQALDGLDEAWMQHQWLTSIEAPPSPRHRVLVAVEQ